MGASIAHTGTKADGQICSGKCLGFFKRNAADLLRHFITIDETDSPLYIRNEVVNETMDC